MFGYLDRKLENLEQATAVYAAAKSVIQELKMRVAQLEAKCIHLELSVPFDLILSEDEIAALKVAIEAFSYDPDDPSQVLACKALRGLVERATNSVS